MRASYAPAEDGRSSHTEALGDVPNHRPAITEPDRVGDGTPSGYGAPGSGTLDILPAAPDGERSGL